MLSHFETKMQERFTKILNAMVTYDENKYCFDCHQRGPIYVNVTIGSFVCTNCGGALRKYNHRVKSISMSNFTPAEIDFLRKRGNKACRKIYLALSDDQSLDEKNFQNGARDDYLRTKYQIQKWYRHPSAELEAEAMRENQEIIDRAEQNGTQRPVGTNTAAGLIVMPSRLTGAPAGSSAVNEEKPSAPMQPSIQTKVPNQEVSTPSTVFDPFGTLRKDSFEGRPPNPSPSVTSSNDPFDVVVPSNFRIPAVEDPFSAFGLSYSQATPVSTSQQTLPFKQSTETLRPGTWMSTPSTISSSQPNLNSTASHMGDKYAALAELDGMFKNANVTTSSTTSAALSSITVPTQSSLNSHGSMHWSETFTPSSSSLFANPRSMAPVNAPQLPPSVHNPFASPMITSTGALRQYSASNPFITVQSGQSSVGPVAPSFQPVASVGIPVNQNPALFQPPPGGVPNPFHTSTTHMPASGPSAWAPHLNSNPIGSIPVPLSATYPVNGFPASTVHGGASKYTPQATTQSNFDLSLFH